MNVDVDGDVDMDVDLDDMGVVGKVDVVDADLVDCESFVDSVDVDSDVDSVDFGSVGSIYSWLS
eukprot:1305620-Amorphochlora_amoeboformis.AAC.2